MNFTSPFLFLSIIGSLFLIASGGIYSSHHHVATPLLHSLHQSKSNSFVLKRFQKYVHSLGKRSAAPSTSDDHTLESRGFSLGNVTTHNQALIHWSGKNSTVILILTRQKGSPPREVIYHSTLWRSTNYGKTYIRQDNKFDKESVLRAYYVCPNNKSKIVFVDTNNRVWVTTDEGDSYSPYNITFSLDKIEYHPDEEDWLLGYDKEELTLYVSQTLGRTWKKLHGEVTQDRYFWYVKGVDIGVNASRTVHMEYRDMDVFPDKAYLIKSCFIPDCNLTPFQEACDKLGAIDKESLVVKDNFTFAQKAGGFEKFFVSYNRADFVKADFPGSYEQTDFHVVSSDGGTVVVGVNHKDSTTNLFFSDPKGQQFTLSLPNVRYFNRKSSGEAIYNVDIHEVSGIKGTFITNQHTTADQNRTMITWDNGRTWNFLTPPGGNKNEGCDGCTLNLHCAMTQTMSGYFMPAMLSKKSVPGLIMAHGSVGETLAGGPASVNVYTSRDAGKTWSKSFKMRHLYVVGDHGAMMVAVRMIFRSPVDSLSFSNDFGKTWSSHKFSAIPINVDGLLTEPGEYTHKFTLFGHRSYHDSWQLFALDMANLVSASCVYPRDFANWTFNPDADSGCHLGMKQTFERVEAADCLVGPSFQMKTQTKFCKCTREDYECGYGFTTRSDGRCVKVSPKIDFIGDHITDEYGGFSTPSPCINGSRKVDRPMYRRIPGDNCVDDLPEMLIATESCDSNAVTSPPTVELRLLNNTNEAKIGDSLRFSVHGSSSVQWSVFRTAEPNVTLTSPDIKRRNHDGTVTFFPHKPGLYEVRAFYPKQPSVSDTIIVSFWYAIEEVSLILPPVVEVNRPYNATAVILTKDGLPGTEQLIGEVSYIWDTGAEIGKLAKTNYIALTATKARKYKVKVVAKNTVSLQTARGSVVVKEYIETLVLPLILSQPIRESHLTHEWLVEVQELITQKIFSTKKMLDVLSSNQLSYGINFNVFIKPRLPLQVHFIFSPTDQSHPSKEKLLQAATDLERLINENRMFVHLPHNVIMMIGLPYVITDTGAFIYPNSLSPGSIAAIVISCVAVLAVILIVVGRKHFRNVRWKSYFIMPTASASSVRSHIVRTSRRSNDTAPIVDEEEFIDDDLDNMEGLASTQTGTLQFQG